MVIKEWAAGDATGLPVPLWDVSGESGKPEIDVDVVTRVFEYYVSILRAENWKFCPVTLKNNFTKLGLLSPTKNFRFKRQLK